MSTDQTRAPFEFDREDDGTLSLRSAVHQALGAASTCWESMAGTGVFDDRRAVEVGAALLHEIHCQTPPDRDRPIPPEGDDVWSNEHHDGHQLSWHELADHYRERMYALQRWSTFVADLDRNANGRHAGDVDGGDPTGISQGNPLLPVGTVLGYSIGGARRAYVVPDRAAQHDLAAWEQDVSGPAS